MSRDHNPALQANDLPGVTERIKAALDSYVPTPAPLPVPKAAPTLECHWRLTPAPTVSEAHKAAIREQRAYEAQEGARATERAQRSLERGIERSNRK